MNRKILSIAGKIIFAIVIIVILSFAILNKNDDTPIKSDGNTKEEKTKLIEIPITHKIPEGETREYILPSFYVTLTSSTGEDIEEWIAEMKEYDKDNMYFDAVYANEDETVTIEITNKQLLHWTSTTEDVLEEQIVENKGKIDIVIDEDFKKATFSVHPGCDSFDWLASSGLVILNLMKAQIFTGVPVEECVVETITIGVKTGEVIENTVFPGGSNEIPGTEWYAKVNGKADETE